MKRITPVFTFLAVFLLAAASWGASPGDCAPSDGITKGPGGLVVIVEREKGSVMVIDSTKHRLLGRVGGLGNLNHGTVKFSRDMRYAYVIGRDARVSKIDLNTLKVVNSVKAGEDSVGGVMTQDGKYIALSNYRPGAIRILDAETLESVKTIPAVRTQPDGTDTESRAVGLIDAPGNLLIFSLMDADGIWVVDAGKPDFPVTRKFWDVGSIPYDALITPDGRYYISGLLKSNWIALLDLWSGDKVRKVKTHKPAEGEEVPLWKIPHLKGWAISGEYAVLPDVQREWAVVLDMKNFELVKHVKLEGTPLYMVTQPGGRYVWVDLVGKNGDLIQIIDLKDLKVIKTLNPGPGATHPQFTAKGEAAYISLMDGGKVVVYDTESFQKITEFPADHPSGIFFTYRANRFGM